MPTIPLKGSIEALCEVKQRGLARHIGVSNFTTKLLFDAIALASEPIVANQCEYHPHLDQSKVIAACKPSTAWRSRPIARSGAARSAASSTSRWSRRWPSG